MSEITTAFVGLDVHKESIAIAVAYPGRDAPRYVGTTGPRIGEIEKALSHLGTRSELCVVYEAGPCGYVLARQLREHGYHCLSPVMVPDESDEAIRDLSRAREDALRARMVARHQLKALLLRHGRHYVGKSSWTLAHERFLATISFAHPAQHITFVEYRTAVREANERLERITAALRAQVIEWCLQPVVAALMTLRGIDFTAAITLVCELGDLKRFAHPKHLMSFLGLVPSESSSGESRSQGGITKTGNSHARRILIEAAWSYRHPARIAREIQIRQEGQLRALREIAWRAQLRLCQRYRRLTLRGMHQNKTCVAIARELSGFMWDLARHVPGAP